MLVKTDAFWALIERYRPLEDEDDLPTMLENLSGDNLLSFHERVAEAIQALNTAAHQAQEVRDADDPPDAPTLPLSDDAFLDARIAVVLSGRTVWQRAVDDPSTFAGTWPITLGGSLEEAIAEAYEDRTDEPFPPIDIDQPQISLDSSGTPLPPQRRDRWLHHLLAPGPRQARSGSRMATSTTSNT